MNIYRHIADTATLEREYSPSSCVPDLPAILRDYDERSLATRQHIPPRTYSYGPADAETLDFFAPAGDKQPMSPRDVAVYIHGGYWQELSKDQHSFPASGFVSRGMAYIAINYGLAPDANLAKMIDRCRRALLWIASHSEELAINPRAIHLLGCSAGGHLAAMCALTDWRTLGVAHKPIRSVTLLSGVFDLRPLPLTYVNDAVGMTAADALLHSPLLMVDTVSAPLPPMLLVVGENETDEFKRQSRDFATALQLRGANARLVQVPLRNHFDLLFDLNDQRSELASIVSNHITLSYLYGA
jgi:arylformamidase